MWRGMELEEKRRRLERRLGAHIEVRGVKVLKNPKFRGRLRVRGSHVIVEYQEEQPGFFWYADTVNLLLNMLAWGARFLVVCELNKEGE